MTTASPPAATSSHNKKCGCDGGHVTRINGTTGWLSEFFIGYGGEPGLHHGRVTAARTSLDSWPSQGMRACQRSRRT